MSATVVEWVAACGGVAGIAAAADAIVKHLRRSLSAEQMVVNQAMGLLAPYERRVNDLEGKLVEANKTITVLTSQLTNAQAHVLQLETKLRDTNTEAEWLRLQVKNLGHELGLDGPPSDKPRE